MRNRCLILFAVVTTIFFAGVAAAQNPVVYPAKGQSAQQTAKDKQACTAWAQQQGSAYHAAAGPPPMEEADSGGMVRSGARGAALGAIGGAIGGDAGKGAAIGAAVFGAGRLLHNLGASRRNEEREEDWQTRQAQAQAARRQHFDRAFSACMQGRGYTVK
jgi:hypothetical protein